MPVMDGYAATRAIRQDPHHRDLPVIAMTANVMAGDREKALAAGMNDHVGKPVKVRELLTTMARWITSAQPEATAGSESDSGSEPGPEAAALPALPGIDTAAGLATAQHNLALYRRLLRRFRGQHAGFAEDFAAALAERAQDPDGPARCAHTLKGVAANIGAEQVRAAAEALEHVCQAGQDAAAIERLLAETRAALGTVLAGLKALEDPAPRPADTRAASGSSAPATPVPAVMADQLEALRGLLEEDNTDAIEMLAELTAQVSGTSATEALRPIADALDLYDFEAALAALAEVEEQLGHVV